MSDRKNFVSGLVGVLVGALIIGGPSAVAAIGDAIAIGQLNSGNAKTTISGSVTGGLVKIKNNQTGGTALVLESNGPNLKISNGQRIDRLNADRVDSFSANQLIRVASASSLNLPDGDEEPFPSGAGTVSVLTTIIQVPGPGFLVVSGLVDLTNTSAFGDTLSCQILVADVPVAGSSMTIDLGAGGGSNGEENCASQGVEEVAAAGSYTVELLLSLVAEDSELDEGSLSVIFIPFGADGTTP